jgi:hypothetical protein
LGSQNESKSSKLKGANKKVKNAKQVAGKEEEKAKEAVEAKQRHLASQRKMKKERDDALAVMQEQRKLNGDVCAQLEMEQSGVPHVRDAALDPDNTVVVVVPVEFEIRRVDAQRTMLEVRRRQTNWTAGIEAWYKEWRKLREESDQVPVAGFYEDMRKGNAKMYQDMLDGPDGCIETGAENDGWRSRRALEATCCHAKAWHDEETGTWMVIEEYRKHLAVLYRF